MMCQDLAPNYKMVKARFWCLRICQMVLSHLLGTQTLNSLSLPIPPLSPFLSSPSPFLCNSLLICKTDLYQGAQSPHIWLILRVPTFTIYLGIRLENRNQEMEEPPNKDETRFPYHETLKTTKIQMLRSQHRSINTKKKKIKTICLFQKLAALMGQNYAPKKSNLT